MINFTVQEGESEEGAKEGGEEGDEPIDPEKLGDMKRTVQNVQVEEPKIVEEARNKQKEKRNEALEKVKIRIYLQLEISSNHKMMWKLYHLF